MAVLTLETDTVRSLLKNQLLLDAFPFLKNAAQQIEGKSGCNKCSKSSENSQVRSVKLAIAGLAPEGQAKFKQITGASQVRIVYRAGNGRLVQVDF